MSRNELRHLKPRKSNLYKWFSAFSLLLISIGFLLGFSKYAQSTINLDTPEFDNGRKVVVHLPNGREVYTYENLIVQEGDKLLYKGERNTLDLTGGKVEFKDW